MKLREQIENLGVKYFNSYYVEAVDFPRLVTVLCEKAFIDEWPNSSDVQLLRYAAKLMREKGFITEEEIGYGVDNTENPVYCGGCGEYWPCSVVNSPEQYRSEILIKHYKK